MMTAKTSSEKDASVIQYQLRDGLGRGHARDLRRRGFVPGVVFGGSKENLHIFFDIRDLTRAFEAGGARSRIVHLQNKDKDQTLKALTKDVHYHPVKDNIEHIDFQRVDDRTEIRVEVNVHAINEELSPGIKVGGVLNLVRHTIEVLCTAGAIPEELIIDLTGLEIGASVHISHIKLPPNVFPVIKDRDFTVATIASVGTVVADEGQDQDDAVNAGASEDKAED